MLPLLALLAPMLGSMGLTGLAGAGVLGSTMAALPGWALAAGGAGLGSLIANPRDPQAALISALTGGVASAAGSGLSSLLRGGTSAAAQTAAQAVPTAISTPITGQIGTKTAMAGSGALGTTGMGAAARQWLAANPANAIGGNLQSLAIPAAEGASRSLLRNPWVLGGAGAGALGLAALNYKGKPPAEAEGMKAQPRNPYYYGNRAVGPVSGVVEQPSMLKDYEAYANYGSGPEINMFNGQENWNRTDPIPLMGGEPLDGNGAVLPPTDSTALELLRKKKRRGMAHGGYVGKTARRKGPGGGYLRGGASGTDTIQAVVDDGTPVRLNNEEYVFSREAVQAAGGPRAMDDLHNKLKSMANGRRQRRPRRKHRASV